jgi:hypothetical protein
MGIKHFCLIYIGLILCWVTLHAQLNESDTAKMQLRAGITGTWQQGNVNLLLLRGRLEAVSNGMKPVVFKTQNNSLYQEFGKNKADNDINSRNYLYYKPLEKVYPFGMFFVQTNYRRQIDFRWFAGGGVTWQFVQKLRSNMKLSGSMVYEETRFRNNRFNAPVYNGSETIPLWRFTTYLSGWHQLFHQRIRLYYTAYWQPGLDGNKNYRTQLDAGIDFPVWKGLNFTVAYSFTHEEVVVEKVKQDDRILTFGLSYQIKKNNTL